MKIKNVKIRWWKGILLFAACSVMLLALPAFAGLYYYSFIPVCDGNDPVLQFGGGKVTDKNGTALPSGDVLQVIQLGVLDNGTPFPPNNDGTPGGTDQLIRTATVGTDDYSFGLGGQAGKFLLSMTVSSPTAGSANFIVRVWNATTVLGASYYADSSVIPVSTLGTPNPNNYLPLANFSATLSKPAPNGPAGFTGTANSLTSIVWSWNDIAGEFNYNVCSSDSTVVGVTITDEVTTTETSLRAGNYPYTRYVLANLTDGQASAHSNQYTAYTLALTPDAISAKGGWQQTGGYFATVTWGAANDIGTLYYLHRLGQPDINGTTAMIGTVEGLTANTVYTFEVRAMNDNAIYTGYGARVTTTTPPAAPTLNATNITTNEITWSWNTVPGADSYVLYVDGNLIPIAGSMIATTEGLQTCRAYTGMVYGVSTLYGTGAPGVVTKCTLPVVPSPFAGQTSLTTSAVDLQWTPDSANVSAHYNVLVSAASSTDGFATKVTGTANKAVTVTCDQDNTYYWFKVVAVNGDGIASASTEALFLKSNGYVASGSGTNPPAILLQSINGQGYLPGELTNSVPVLTAMISGDVDPSTITVTIDRSEYSKMVIPASDITWEVVSGGYMVTAYVRSPISATPVNAHTVTITATSLSGGQAEFDGTISVMSGKVQVVGPLFNYPNPFQPLSGNPDINHTNIAYNLSVDANVMVIIYDITGHEMFRQMYGAGTMGGRAGANQVIWNGRNLFNKVGGNGMYIYKIISSNNVLGSGKLVILDR